jgi:hypothetical protein
MLPKNSAPNGRTTKPAAKAPRAKINPALSLPAVKCFAMTEASAPNRKKSYHSNTVPIDEAATTRTRLRSRGKD